MPLTQDQEDHEHKQRMALMAADIELKQAQTAKSKQDWRLDPQRVIIQAALAGAAVFGAFGTVIGTLLGYFLRGSTTGH